MSNTLKFGNGEWYGKEGTILAYNSENNNYKPLPFTFERDSVATRVNKQGLIETVGADQPRIDYLNNSNGALLLEPSRTNSVTYSEDFSSFSFGRTVRTVSTELTPKGIADSTKVSSQSGTSGTHRFYSNDISVVSGTNYTISIFVKKGTSKKLEFTLLSNVEGGIGFNNCIFDFDEKTVTNGNVEDYGNDWFRISLSSTPTTTSVAKIFGYVYNEEGSRTYLSNGNENFYIFGAQLEEGSYPTSYIPTQGSAVTRVVDVCYNGGNEQVINSTEGVLYAEIKIPENIADNINISINDGTNDEYVKFIYLATTNTFRGQIQGSGNQVGVNTTSLVLGSYSKVAVSYKSGEFKLYINGSQIGSTLTGHTLPTGLYTLSFDRGDGDAPFQGNVKDVRVYNTALTDQELAALTQV